MFAPYHPLRAVALRPRPPAPRPPVHTHTHTPLPTQPDKVNNEGLGHTSPLDIPIPGAQPGEEEDYYYHDR